MEYTEFEVDDIEIDRYLGKLCEETERTKEHYHDPSEALHNRTEMGHGLTIDGWPNPKARITPLKNMK